MRDISTKSSVILSLMLFTMVGTQALAQKKSDGADSQGGYIIRKTKDGIVKIPKNQTFRFGGSDVQAGVNRPGQSVLGRRPQPMRSTLIQERQSFRSETLRDAGLVGGN